MSFRPSLYPTIGTVLGLALLISLGSWQFQRYQQKRALEREKAQRSDKPVVDVHSADAFSKRDLGHRSVRLYGELLPETRIVFESRFQDGEPGVWLASPFQLAGGGLLLVNRGWIPFQEAKGTLPDDLYVPETGPDNPLLGVAHPIGRPVRDAFMRKQIADGEVTVWQHETRWDSVDVPAITDAVAPHVRGDAPETAFLVALDKRHSGDPFPVAGTDQKVQKFLTAGRHLGYAVFWFAVAAALVGMYIAASFGVLGSFSRGSRRDSET